MSGLQKNTPYLIQRRSKAGRPPGTQSQSLLEVSIEDHTRIQGKEIWKLKQMNQYLQSSLEHRDNILEKERLQFKDLKTLCSQMKPNLQELAPIRSIHQNHTRYSAIFDGKSFSKEVQSPEKRRSLLPNQSSRSRRIESPNKAIDSGVKERRNKTHLQIPILVPSFTSLKMDSEPKLEEFKYSSVGVGNILDMQLNDEEAIHQYEEDGNIKFVEALLTDEDKFVKLVTQSGYQKLAYIYEKLKKLIQDHRSMFMMVLRMKTSIKGAFEITQSLVLDEALEKIVQQTVTTLGCDRSTCYVADQQKGELWSKVAQGLNSVIRFPLNTGVAGYVATRKEVVNIQNAYSDVRFNKDIDSRSSYKTKTILAAPIMDKEQCLGVLQCINKVQGFFSKEDETLLQILCDFSKIVLKHTMSNDQQQAAHNKLRNTIRCGIQFQEAPHNLQTFLKLAEKNIKGILSTDLARIAIRRGEETIYYDDAGQLHAVNTKCGLINHTINTQKQINIYNAMEDAQFCPTVDLDTALPILCVPIMLGTVPIGGLMVVNFRGLSMREQNLQPRIAPIDMEVMDYFTQQLARVLVNFI